MKMDEPNSTEGFDVKSLEKALQDPSCKNQILKLLSSQKKNVFEFFNPKSPLRKVQKRDKCESPTALLRRRELEKVGRSATESPQSSSSSNSRKSLNVKFDRILIGVVAYIEINSNGNDRSAGAKALLKSMGGVVRDNFTKDVTHVIFKDGSYNTYQRAKLLKVHFVSVLWLEASRRAGIRELEKNFPALGTKNYDQNVSLICSQMQKEYEDVIRSEIRRTLESGTSLPSTKSLMESTSFSIPNGEVDNILCKIRNLSQSQDTRNLELGNISPMFTSDDDTEIESINSNIRTKLLPISSQSSSIGSTSKRTSMIDDTFEAHQSSKMVSTMDITCQSDDSDDCRSLISRRRVSRTVSNMDLTNVQTNERKSQHSRRKTLFECSNKSNYDENESSDSEIYKLSTPKYKNPLKSVENLNKDDEIYHLKTPKNVERRKSMFSAQISNNLEDIEESTTDSENIENLDTTNKSDTSNQNKNNTTNISSLSSDDENRFKKPEFPSKSKKLSTESSNHSKSSNMSSLRLSTDDSKKLNKEKSTEASKSSVMSSLRLSSENANSTGKSSTSNMSSLRLSSEKSGDKISRDVLNVSNESDKTSEWSFATAEDGTEKKDENLNIEAQNNTNTRSSGRKTQLPNFLQTNYEVDSIKTNKTDSKPSFVNTNPRKRRNVSDNEQSTSNSETSNENLSNRRKSMRLRAKSNNEADESNNSEKIGKKVEILENISIVPARSENSKTRNLRRKTICSNSNVTEKGGTEDSNQVLRKSRRKTIAPKTNVDVPKERENLIIKSNSESEIAPTQRRRRLFDLNCLNDDADGRKSSQDEEERKRIRAEKSLKNKEQTKGIIANGNLFLTEKAAELLNKGNCGNELKRILDTPKVKPKNQDVSILEKSSDVQTELIEEFVNKKRNVTQPNKAETQTPSRKRIIRTLTQPVAGTSTPKNSRIPQRKAETDCQKTRRSTLEFQTHSQKIPRIRSKINLNQKPTIVCTKMHKPDVQLFGQIVKKLGRFEIEDEVSSRTTHLVVGEIKRTINLLRALARGCWILKKEWLLSSLEEGKWLPEDKYEAVEFSPAVLKCRMERLVLGPKYTMNIFFNCGRIFVDQSTIPRCSDLRELIVLCEGKVIKNCNNADIIVGCYLEGFKCVNEYWILDSITNGKLKNLNKYAITHGN